MADFILNSEDFGLKIYDRFPPRYQVDDADNRFALRRYLDACGEGGFKHGIDEWNGILDFANPDQATPQALPFLYEQYGLPIFNGIPEMYLRYLLPRLGRAWQKKGGLDVIEFVASALAGVRTNTVVNYDQDYNVDVDLRLEMDYSLGDYFPDTKQLYRLLEKFLPFYLGITIIYTYVFHDESGIHGEDVPRLDLVTYTTNEKGLIYSSGTRLIPMTFPAGPHGLNVDFILNKYERVAPDPDQFTDIIGIRYNEHGSFAHRFTPVSPYVPLLNTYRELNRDLILPDGKLHLPQGVHLIGALNNPEFRLNDLLRTSPAVYIEVDDHFDKVVSVYTDTITPKVIRDDIKDRVVIKPYSYPALNTGLVLNYDFILNSDNCEYGMIRDADESSVDLPKTTYQETAFMPSEDDYLDKVVQTPFKEQNGLDTEENNTAHLTLGSTVCFMSTLNTGYLTLNNGLVTNRSNVEEGRIKTEDREGVLSIKNTIKEDAAFVFSPLLCMLTNTSGLVLNHAALKVPDGIDIVCHRDGSRQTIFH